VSTQAEQSKGVSLTPPYGG